MTQGMRTAPPAEKRNFANGVFHNANGATFPFAIRERGGAEFVTGLVERLKPYMSGLVFILSAGTFLAFLAPYTTGSLGWPAVWFYWTGLIAFGALCGQGAARIIDPIATGWPDWLRYGAISVAVSVPITAAVLVLQAWAGHAHDLRDWPMIFFFVWVISAAVTAVSYLADRHREAGRAESPQPGRALTDKLPVRLKRADIWALESEDHYLRVHTASGDALILMRLADAIAAVEMLEGAQTHRSWWVARDAVTDAATSGGRAILTLRDGTEAPVSRTFAPGLKKAGWF
tara:strand:- start:406 stop:1269 length:864 start_codon:yes stop_codon:yes gene_type:complete